MRRYLIAPPARFARTPALPLLVWITISGTFPMHLLVPVLPETARDLHVSAATIQSAITSYLVGLATGQLLLGPLSDRFGRRPVLIGGLLIYILGTLGSALSPTIQALVVARAVQGVGGCAGLVLGRAIARDTSGETGAVKKIALLSSMTSLGPGIAPLVGTYLALLMGWRGMLEILAMTSMLLFAVTALTLPETHAKRHVTSIASYVRTWGELARNRRFLRFCIGGAFGTTSFYAFVANAPFIFHEKFGFSRASVGLLYLLVVSSLTTGGLAASRLAGRVQAHRMVVLTSAVMTLGSLATLAMQLAGTPGPVSYIIAIMTVTGSIGVCSPFAMSEAVNVDPQSIGAASGLYGCLQMTAGALLVVAVGHIPAPPIMATSLGLIGASGLALVAFSLPIGSAGLPVQPLPLSDAEADAAM